ncbi:hypothetical protein OS493_011704 [Desmophyllum pertusum]|uniref:Uncharacterized protein n=1 Tax=Desmophyllum pertusum TaxID=174260 RepID=A0A9W9YDQ1_9CNID|nr:hypothetical protein OS493_011704 [Desmophyllum pertusum]
MEKYRIIDEIKKVDEIEETPVVAICIRCPSDTGSWQSHLEIKPATEKVSSTCSIEVKDIEFIDEFFSDLSVNERDVTHSQTEVLGMRNQDHELRERYDAQEQSIKNNLNSFTAGSKKEERQLKPASIDDEESSSWAIELPGASEVQPRHEDMVRIYDVDCHEDSSSSVSPASSRSSSAASRNSSIASDENPEESSVSRHHRHRGVESTSEKVHNGERVWRRLSGSKARTGL